MLLVVAVQGISLGSAWLKDVALTRLVSPWLVQGDWPVDAPCQRTADLAGTEDLIQRSIALADDAPARLLTQLGRVVWSQGRCDEAIGYWRQTLQQGDLFAGYELARVGKEDALPLDLRLTLAERAYRHGINLRDRGDRETARQWFLHAFKLAPQHRSAVELANQYQRAGQHSEIRALWQQMVDRLTPSDPDHWWGMAGLYEQDSDWAAAGLAYEHGAELSADPHDFWYHAGLAWEKAPEWDNAVAAYQKAAAVTPYPIFAYLRLGFGYSGQGDYREALRYLQLAQDVDPSYYRSYYYLGVTYYRMGDLENARYNLNLALERSPDDGSTMYLLARMWYDMGQPEIAETWLVRAIDHIDPPQATWWIQLGDWRLVQRRCEDAAQAYSSAHKAGAEASTLQARTRQYAEVCSAKRSF